MQNSNEKSKCECKEGASDMCKACHLPPESKCENATCNMLDGHKHISQIGLKKWEENTLPVKGFGECCMGGCGNINCKHCNTPNLTPESTEMEEPDINELADYDRDFV